MNEPSSPAISEQIAMTSAASVNGWGWRKLALKLHLYLALFTGVFVLIVALSGAALVFEQELDHVINRATWKLTPQGQKLPLEVLVARFHQQLPDKKLSDIVIAQEPDLAYRFRMDGPGDLDAMMNPYTGQVQGVRDFAKVDWGTGFPRMLHNIHTRLLAGKAGEYFVGAITIVTLVILATGIVLWWQRKIGTVMWSASWKRINFDLHSVFGIYAALFLVYVTLSGIIISFEGFTDPFLKKHLNAHADVQPRVKSTPVVGGKRVPVDEALNIAEQALPGAAATIVNVPSSPTEAYRITKRYPEDRAASGRSRVYLDQYSGKVLYVKSTRTDELGTTIINIKRSVHTGDIFGWPTRLIAFFSCLFLVGQMVTGTIIWWKKVQVPLAKTQKGERA